MLDVTLKLGFLIYFLTVKPFNSLDLGIHFSMLKSKILHTEGLLSGDEELDQRYNEQLTICFYIYWYLREMIPSYIIDCLCCSDEESEKDFFDTPTFKQISDHYTENHNQVSFLLSVKYLTQ